MTSTAGFSRRPWWLERFPPAPADPPLLRGPAFSIDALEALVDAMAEAEEARRAVAAMAEADEARRAVARRARPIPALIDSRGLPLIDSGGKPLIDTLTLGT